MPPYGLAVSFIVTASSAIHRALVYRVIADRIVTIQPQFQEVHHKRVARLGAFEKKGPVSGLPPNTRFTPFSSVPPASTVVVCTVSPGAIVSTGLLAGENCR